MSECVCVCVELMSVCVVTLTRCTQTRTHTHTHATVQSLDVTGRCRGLRAQVCAACALLLCTTCHLSRCFCHTLMGLLPSANVPRASCPVLRTDCSKLRLPARPVVRQQRKSGRAPRRGRRGCVWIPPTRWGGVYPSPYPSPQR